MTEHDPAVERASIQPRQSQARSTVWASERTSRREPVSEKHAKRLVNIVHAFVAEVIKMPASRFEHAVNEGGMKVVGDEVYFSPGFRCKMGSVLFAYCGRLIDRVVDRSLVRRRKESDDGRAKLGRGYDVLLPVDLREEIVETAGLDLWDGRRDMLAFFTDGKSMPTSFFKWIASPYIVRKDFMVDLFAVLLSVTQKAMLVHLAPVAPRRGDHGQRRLYVRERTLTMALSRTKTVRGKTYNNFQRFDPRLSMTFLGVDAAEPGLCEPVGGMPRFSRRVPAAVGGGARQRPPDDVAADDAPPPPLERAYGELLSIDESEASLHGDGGGDRERRAGDDDDDDDDDDEGDDDEGEGEDEDEDEDEGDE